MALDLIARATAAAAKSAASQALGRTTTIARFTDLPSASIDASVSMVSTAGHSAPGSGRGNYVSDALATAALAAAHPRFCKADATGRFFRLAGPEISVDQGGATGSGNDQPAIQATINYATAVGIGEVRFTRQSYDLWCPTRTSTFGPGWQDAPDGYPIVITNSIALKGLPGGTRLRFLNNSGGLRTSGLQTTAWGTWYGGGIFIACGWGGSTADIEHISIENLELDGTVPCTDPYTNAGANISDKGIMTTAVNYTGIRLLTLKNLVVHNFCGELFYGGAFKADSSIVAENVEMYGSNQSAWNPTGLGKVFCTNCNFHDAYPPAEIISGQGHVYVGCRFANGSNCGAISTQYFAAGYFYSYPNRDTTKPPTWVEHHDTVFENIASVNLSSWTKGKVTLIDSSFINLGADERDIDLDVLHITDSKTGTGITLGGPATLTQQWPSSPAGTYSQPPCNITLRTEFKRTAKAVAAGLYSAGVVYNNLIDHQTVRVSIAGEVRESFRCGATPAGFRLPLTRVDPAVFLYAGGQPTLGGIYDTPSANVTYKVAWPSLAIMPNAGPIALTLDTTSYSYAEGQLVTIYYGQNTSHQVTLAASGAGMILKENRTLRGYRDQIVLRWSNWYNAWVEQDFSCMTLLVLRGSATYDAPSIAPGAQTTTTVTVTGAALGDYVDRVSFGVDLQGMIASAYVSAANTVTVVIRNGTAAAVDLASTSLSAEVRKKI